MSAGDVASKRRIEFSEKDTMEVLRLMRANYKVDDSRIYLLGHSMGAIGAWYLGQKYPDIWAAIALISGSGSVETVTRMKDIPQFVVHGDNDPTVNVNGSRRMVDAMKKAGMNVTYTEVPGGNHTDVVVPNLPKAFEFMVKQHKAAAGSAIENNESRGGLAAQLKTRRPRYGITGAGVSGERFRHSAARKGCETVPARDARHSRRFRAIPNWWNGTTGVAEDCGASPTPRITSREVEQNASWLQIITQNVDGLMNGGTETSCTARSIGKCRAGTVARRLPIAGAMTPCRFLRFRRRVRIAAG